MLRITLIKIFCILSLACAAFYLLLPTTYQSMKAARKEPVFEKPTPISKALTESSNRRSCIQPATTTTTNHIPSNANNESSRFPKQRYNVFFLKTHKTASSAVQNVLLRYGLRYDLWFALPQNEHDFGYPGKFRRSSIALQQGRRDYNILCHHMRFNYNEVKSVLPKTSLYVSIVREPGALFESTFDYLWDIVPAFKQVPHKGKNSAETWLDKAAEYLRVTKKTTYWFFAKNPMIFDFGFDNMREDEKYISSAVKQIHDIFDLILIADYYEESMVLLSHILRCPLEDVVCLNLNARKHDEDSNSEQKARIREKSRAWNKADAALYDFSNVTFWRKVEEFGRQRMDRELQKLRDISSNVTAKCIDGKKAVDSSQITDRYMKKWMFKPKGVAVSSYNLKPGSENITQCRQLVMPENAFNHLVFDHQKKA